MNASQSIPWRRIGVAIAWLVALIALRVGAAESPADEPAIKLPPMVVSESTKAPRWWYVSVADGEYLSRCSTATTRDFVTAELRMTQLVHVLIPAEFLARSDVPTVTVLTGADVKQQSDALVHDMVRTAEASNSLHAQEERRRRSQRVGRVEVLPNLRLQDRDLKALFVSLDEHTFDSERLVLVPEFVRDLLEKRTPMLPPWAIEGLVAVYGGATFTVDPITLKPTVWLSGRDSRALAKNDEWPRTLLPVADLFVTNISAAEGGTSLHGRIWRAELQLFVRWALDPRNAPARDGFWRFVQRSSEAPATEEMFQECFGFGYSGLLDRLSDYLPLAVKGSIRIEPGKLPKLPRIEPRPATPDEVARLQGEWERLEIAYVQARYPQFTRDYVTRARQTLHRAYDRGARDGRLDAAIGLCEIDAGDTAAAIPFLEQAAESGVKRPRVYAELARLRYAEWLQQSGGKPAQSAETLAPVLEPLRIAAQQSPALPEAYALLVECWLRCRARPPEGDFAILERGARLFRWRPELAFRIAALNAAWGHRDRALALLDESIGFVPDDATRARFEAFRAAIKGKG